VTISRRYILRASSDRDFGRFLVIRLSIRVSDKDSGNVNYKDFDRPYSYIRNYISELGRSDVVIVRVKVIQLVMFIVVVLGRIGIVIALC